MAQYTERPLFIHTASKWEMKYKSQIIEDVRKEEPQLIASFPSGKNQDQNSLGAFAHLKKLTSNGKHITHVERFARDPARKIMISGEESIGTFASWLSENNRNGRNDKILQVIPRSLGGNGKEILTRNTPPAAPAHSGPQPMPAKAQATPPAAPASDEPRQLDFEDTKASEAKWSKGIAKMLEKETPYWRGNIRPEQTPAADPAEKPSDDKQTDMFGKPRGGGHGGR